MVGIISAIEHFTYAGLFVVLLLCGLACRYKDVAVAGGYLVHRGITRHPTTLAVWRAGARNSPFFLGAILGVGWCAISV